MKKLHVVKINNHKLHQEWGYNPFFPNDSYVRCNAKGEVNWSKAPVYTANELIERDNVVILK